MYHVIYEWKHLVMSCSKVFKFCAISVHAYSIQKGSAIMQTCKHHLRMCPSSFSDQHRVSVVGILDARYLSPSDRIYACDVSHLGNYLNVIANAFNNLRIRQRCAKMLRIYAYLSTHELCACNAINYIQFAHVLSTVVTSADFHEQQARLRVSFHPG